MECAPVSKLLDGPGWLYEIKLDGYRAIAVKSGRVDLFSRRHKSFNHQYPHLVEALGELPEGTVVDGEVVALDESGRPNFSLLQNFRSEASRIHYFIFDLLVCQDRDLTRLPLSDRRKLMKSVVKLRSSHLRIAEQFDATANGMIAAVRRASPQCQPTTHTKEKDLDRIEHTLYTSRTRFTGKNHSLESRGSTIENKRVTGKTFMRFRGPQAPDDR